VEKNADLTVIGGGPAGLMAAIEAAKFCKNILILEDKDLLGGQLIKQTHRFFGDAKHYAGIRGIRIAKELQIKVDELKNIYPLAGARVFGIFDNNTIGAIYKNKVLKINSKKTILSTGAYERTLIFEGNDLPGVYGAGGVQTLMNTYAVKPGRKTLVVGSGNVGLILSYQLLQSNVEVVAIVEALPKIGGYFVHAAKVKRYGVEIYPMHTVIRANGNKKVENAIIVQLNDEGNIIHESEKKIECDLICIAVGLTPTYELIQQVGAKMLFIPELGGFVPTRNKYMQAADGVYIAGDLAGIEEATTAMLEGQIAGLHASLSLGHGSLDEKRRIDNLLNELEGIRSGPLGTTIRLGLKKSFITDVI
jgi:sarcosine oxidase subunit alpha